MKISTIIVIVLAVWTTLFLSEATTNYNARNYRLRFAIVADMDRKTKGEKYWRHTVLKVGVLTYSLKEEQQYNKTCQDSVQFSISWEREIPLKARHSYKNRGLELSDLVYWNGALWSICDSTGILYEFVPTATESDKNSCTEFLCSGGIDLVPRLIVSDDSGNSTLPAKNEWMIAMGEHLVIGGHGREWVDSGIIMGNGGEWIKVVSMIAPQSTPFDDNDTVERKVLTLSYRNWQRNYHIVRSKLKAEFPGYVSHEGVEWWADQQKLLFFPRKISSNMPYDDETDEVMGNSHQIVLASADFQNVTVQSINYPDIRDLGASGIRAVPGHDGVFMVLRVFEKGDEVATDIDIFSVFSGNSLLLNSGSDEVEITRPGKRIILEDGSFEKFEGIEFLP